MEAKAYLADYAQKADPIIARFFDQKIAEAEKISPIAVDMLRRYQRFLRGGKKIRGGLAKLGYELCGGENKKAILRASVAIEIIHAFLLMHDDFMDQDNLRRGQPTIHKQYEVFHKERLIKGDPGHYGESMAVSVGDLGTFLGHEIFIKSGFAAERVVAAIEVMSRLLANVALGQGLDITLERYKKVSQKAVLLVHEHKSAQYTVTLPLMVGVILAGAGDKVLSAIEGYGLPVGLAFQIRDDELGLFSNKKRLGKPVGSDVRENKNTLLRLKALEEARGRDRKFLEYAYGNRDLTDEEIERVRKITIETGALDYSQKVGWGKVSEGKKCIGKITKDPYYQALLASFADFMMERES